MSGDTNEKARQIAFRLAPNYAAKVAEAARAAGISPNQFSRVATMAYTNNSFLDLSARMARIEDELVRIRRDMMEISLDE